MFDPNVIKYAELREFYDYWLSKHRGSQLPSRADVDPLEIPGLLRNIALFQVVNDGEDFIFTLAGSRIEEVHGRSLKGLSIYQLQKNSVVAPALQHYTEVAQIAEPRYREGNLEVLGKEHWASCRLLLPLSSDGKKVDMIFAAALFWPSSGSYRPGQ